MTKLILGGKLVLGLISYVFPREFNCWFSFWELWGGGGELYTLGE
jgi:hypothetical protein